MSNFDTLFMVIKRRCEKQARFAEISGFESIAKEANIPLSRLPFYLNHLQDIGLIKYSMADAYIYLAAPGKKYVPSEDITPAAKLI